MLGIRAVIQSSRSFKLQNILQLHSYYEQQKAHSHSIATTSSFQQAFGENVSGKVTEVTIEENLTQHLEIQNDILLKCLLYMYFRFYLYHIVLFLLLFTKALMLPLHNTHHHYHRHTTMHIHRHQHPLRRHYNP